MGDHPRDAPGRDFAVHSYATVNVVSHDAKCLRSGTDSMRLRKNLNFGLAKDVEGGVAEMPWLNCHVLPSGS